MGSDKAHNGRKEGCEEGKGGGSAEVVEAMYDGSHGGTVSASIMTGSGALLRSR